jgi:class 3 adenylate cyclase
MGGRRLTAVMAADIAGYSALMGANDVETLADLKGHQSAVLSLVAGYDGRVIDTAGDGVLAEFPSVLNAVKCAIAIQEVMSERNASVAPERRMQFRIGINQGDVLFDGDRIYGDSINVAARLEGICEPGGICISGKVFEEIKGRFEIQYNDIGDQTLKNISQPVRAYRISVSRSSLSKGTENRALLKSAVAAAVVAFAIIAGAVALFLGRDWTASRTHVTADGIQERLSAALEASVPKMPLANRQQAVAAFAKGKAHRAMAVAHAAQRIWWTPAWSNRETAEEKALEKCQQYFDELCALVATDDFVLDPGVDGRFQVRDAPRVRYSGVFNPERIPAITKAVEQRMDVAGYLTAPSPKASAFHAGGLLHIVVGAPSQRAAEEQALRACNDDPARARAGSGPCYLYSVDNRVVLPLRATGAITSVAVAREASLRDTLLTAIRKIAPTYAHRDEQVRQYVESAPHKALAAHPPSGSWRLRGQESPSIAEERVLEACQVRYEGACVLVAVNDVVQASANEMSWTRRAMSRVAYEGAFDPGQVPAVTRMLRQRADVVGYPTAARYKAAALHPWGRLFLVTGAATQRAAEEGALAACNGDPEREGRDGPCLLYAVDNQVVLPKRSIGPLTGH